jgi:tetratricopeptide (TPR) repeat protein
MSYPDRLDRTDVALRELRVARVRSEHFCSLLAELTNLYKTSKESRIVVLSRLRTDWHNIADAQHWAVSHATIDSHAASLLSLLRGVSSPALSLVLGPAQRIQWLEALLPDVPGENDEKDLAMMGNLANAYSEIDQASKSIQLLECLLPIAESKGFQRIVASAVGNLANLYAKQSDLGKALDYYRRSLEAQRYLGNKIGEASILNNIGHIHRRKSEFLEAGNAFREAYRVFSELNEIRYQAITLGGLGTVARAVGKSFKALEYQTERLVLVQEFGRNTIDEVNALNGLGLAQYELKDFPKAEQSFLSALKIARSLGARASEAENLGNLGLVFAARLDFEQAYESHKQQLKIARSINDMLTQSTALGGMGTAAKNMGLLAEAIEYKNAQLKLAEQIDNPKGKANAHGGLSTIYLEQNEYDRAWSHHLESIKIFQKIGDVVGEGRQYVIGAHIKISSQRFEEALDCLNLADQILPETYVRERQASGSLREKILDQ